MWRLRDNLSTLAPGVHARQRRPAATIHTYRWDGPRLAAIISGETSSTTIAPKFAYTAFGLPLSMNDPPVDTFLVRYTSTAADKTSRGSVTTTYPKATAAASMSMTLLNPAGTPVASSTSGAKPATISASGLAKGTYSLVVATTGAGTGTTTGTFTSGAPYVEFGYDANDHATTIDDGSQSINETLSPSGRVLERKVVDNATGNIVEDFDYGFTDSGDSPAYTRPHGSTNPATYTTYAGGAIVTAGVVVFQHANGHGDIIGTSDTAGNYTPVAPTDEYGLGTTPASRLGWLGQQQRFVTSTTTGIIRMGVRLYDPQTGRFLSTDPIEGGSSNDYDYVAGDPINNLDLAGTICWSCHARNAKKWVNRNRWKLAGLGVSAICIAGTGGAGTAACLAAGGALLAYKTRATIRARGGWKDHAWNAGSTFLFMMGGSGWSAAGLKGLAGYGARAMAESFGIVCSFNHKCASPGLPR